MKYLEKDYFLATNTYHSTLIELFFLSSEIAMFHSLCAKQHTYMLLEWFSGVYKLNY